MGINELDEHFGRRSSCTCAKNARAFRRISLASLQLSNLPLKRLESLRCYMVRPSPGLMDDIVKGRYRILSITAASVEVEDMTRRTRLTLRLSGA